MVEDELNKDFKWQGDFSIKKVKELCTVFYLSSPVREYSSSLLSQCITVKEKMLESTMDVLTGTENAEAVLVVFCLMSSVKVIHIPFTQKLCNNEAFIHLKLVTWAAGPKGMRSLEAEELWLEILQ